MSGSVIFFFVLRFRLPCCCVVMQTIVRDIATARKSNYIAYVA